MPYLFSFNYLILATNDYISITGEKAAKQTTSSLETNFRDVESICKYENTDVKNTANKLSMKYSYVKGNCLHNIKAQSIPKVFQLNDQFKFDSVTSLIKLVSVLKKCFESRDRSECTILCNNFKEIEAVKYAIDRADIDNDPVVDLSYFPGNKSMSDKIERSGHVLICHYRNFRGCEAIHSIIFL